MDPHTMKYTELKDELKKRNIKCTGSKDELCQKLIEAMSQDGQTAVADPAPQQPAPVEEPTKTISQGISNVYQISSALLPLHWEWTIRPSPSDSSL